MAIARELCPMLPRMLPREGGSGFTAPILSRKLLKKLVPRVGFEPTAYRLRSGCSTAELSGLLQLQPVPAYYPIVRPEPSGSAGSADTTDGSGTSTAGSISGAVPVAG